MIQCPKCSVENLPESRFCSSCGQELSSVSQMPTVAVPEGEAPSTPLGTPHVGRIVSSDTVPAGGFTPGTILTDRYRIIGLLGRGGMGEVYRADDLKLGQPVALKFLPPKLSDDSVRRERFFAEVRITRQLSHPNICRVYDIAEVDGRHFLSMEYIDGEDLASLMTRIGHLTDAKALDIARQLVAGLSVAHERGVLHRDLKPANIMLDGHGRVRITDFGLAIAAEDESQAEEIAGTPAYMAPEQLAGKGATIRSDIYSLGLILYEIYTGKRAFRAKTLVELRDQKETHTPRAPSEIREGIDPVVERLIQRCMEKDPNSRPASVAQLAQALPGGDPLAAAIAAGETPSPEMVAASGSKEGLRPVVAWSILACIILGVFALTAINDRIRLHRRIPFEKHPEALVEDARDIIKKAGYSEEFADSDYGFIENSDLLRHIENSENTSSRWLNLDAKAILFWYRQSLRPLEGYIAPNLGYINPPLRYSGEVLVVLDSEGKLVSFRGVPPQVESDVDTVDLEWEMFFEEAGLDISKWTQTDAQWSPHSFADTRIAWMEELPNQPGPSVRIEASVFRGKVVNFEIVSPWTRAEETGPVQMRPFERVTTWAAILFLGGLVTGGIIFARRNLRLGRGDRRNALRLSFLAMGLLFLMVILSMHHTLTFWEIILLFLVAGLALLLAGLLWILYIAIEPFIRRRWPQILVSWTRLLAGKWRDPLVAREALFGCASGTLWSCMIAFAFSIVPLWFGRAEFYIPGTFQFATAEGSRFFISGFTGAILARLYWDLGGVSLLLFLSILLRNQKAAFVAWMLLWTFTWGPNNPWTFMFFLVQSGLWLFLVMRFGFLCILFFGITLSISGIFPITLDVGAWYSGAGYMALAIFAIIVLYAFRTSLGGRPLFGTPRLDE